MIFQHFYSTKNDFISFEISMKNYLVCFWLIVFQICLFLYHVVAFYKNLLDMAHYSLVTAESHSDHTTNSMHVYPKTDQYSYQSPFTYHASNHYIVSNRMENR